MTMSLRERAYEIGRTTVFTEWQALTAAALISESYPDQNAAIRFLDVAVQAAQLENASLVDMALALLASVKELGTGPVTPLSARVAASIVIADREDTTDWQRGYRACADNVTRVLEMARREGLTR